MKISTIVALPVVLSIFFVVAPVSPKSADEAEYEEWVEYKDGEISVAFEHTPLQVALYHIRARTGLEIIVPSASESKSLNLRLSRLSLEPAVRSLLSSMGFNSFALMYDDMGRPNRAVVLEVQPQEPASAVPDVARSPSGDERAAQALTAEEKEKLQNQLERWGELQPEERARLEEQLKSLPPSEEREQLVKEYGRQALGLKN